MIDYSEIPNTVLEIGNMGGINDIVYFAPKADFAELAERPSEKGDRSFEDMNKLVVGKDRLKPGKRLYPLYTTLEKGSLTAPRQGESDAISHKPTLKLFNPGLTSVALAMLLIPNQNWIFYVPSGNQMFRLGGKQFAAKLAAEGEAGTGDATASAKGNEMTFYTYDVGFAPEVVDIDAIIAMVGKVDESLTATFDPVHGTLGVAVITDPTIAFSEAIVNADTGAAFTNQEIEAAITFKALDLDGKPVADVDFTAAIVGNTVTIAPNADLPAATMFELKFNSSKVLSAAEGGRVNGSNYVRFTTA